MARTLWTAAAGLLALVLVGCASSHAAQQGTTPTPAQAEAEATADATAEPQATPTPAPTASIRVWWPDELYPDDGSPAQELLTRQFDDFAQTYASYDLQVRRKRSSGLGGILPTLRTARPVAPNALPDLTLMRRSDLVAAATEGLIVPIADWVPAGVLEGLVPGVQALGELDGTLYGVPYLITLYHVAYRETVHPTPPLTFDDVLAQEPTYLFPGNIAGGGTAANWTVLLQYLAAGGRLVDDAGVPTLDQDPLMAVYSFYERGVEQGIFSPDLLNYTQAGDYWEHFETGSASMIFITSMAYLHQETNVPNTAPASIPTLDGTPITTPDGWMWVLTTNDPDRQSQARAFLSWMMRVSQQSAFSEAAGYLPTTERAFRLWENQDYIQFAQSLIGNMVILPDNQRANSAVSALQAGFAAVLEGTPAPVAAEQAIQLATG